MSGGETPDDEAGTADQESFPGAKLAQDALKMITSLVAGAATGDSCPLCRARERFGQVRPETWEHLSAAAGDLALALLEVLGPTQPQATNAEQDTGDEGPTNQRRSESASRRTPGGRPPTAQEIDIQEIDITD